MNNFAKRLKNCRENLKKSNPQYTQSFVAEKIGVARTTYTAYENGTKTPPPETLSIIANYFDVSVDYLLGRDKEEKDIAKRMQQLRNDLQNAEGLAFDGEPMSDEARESLLEAMEFGVRLAKKNNKKFIPKKYRENNEE
ncbi:helix-turn-helix domain-containing protein [Lysinibacillus sp. 54212]|uniref:helix-turn-helix domain-containing protein n=1 Tax=Lysinibacillus sp. 54212 TaxID=3119829 RepID=UPI002FC89F5B